MRFHAFRRFREAVLQKSEARQLLIDYWMGHENDDMSTRYGKQLLEDVNYRKEWSGFEPPTSWSRWTSPDKPPNAGENLSELI